MRPAKLFFTIFQISLVSISNSFAFDDVGFSDTQVYIGTELKTEGSPSNDFMKFVIHDGNGDLISMSDCFYKINDLQAKLPELKNETFRAEAKTLLSGSFMSTMASCEFEKNLSDWVQRTDDKCPIKNHLKNCKYALRG